MKQNIWFYALLLFSAWLLMHCSAPANLQQGYYPNHRNKYSIQLDKEGRKQGPEIWWYDNGVKKYASQNVNNQRKGVFTSWYPSGVKWYEGSEENGKAEGTLTYWRPNGKLKSIATFQNGNQINRQDFDENGLIPNPHQLEDSLTEIKRLEILVKKRDRDAALQQWVFRVRKTMETYWNLPRQFSSLVPCKAIAKIKVDHQGTILEVKWNEKSPNTIFQNTAQQCFRKIKKFPPMPAAITDTVLDIQYEFVSPAIAAKTAKSPSGKR